MPRNNFDPDLKVYSSEETMSKNELEQYFTALQTDMVNFKEEVNQRFADVDKRFEQVDRRFDAVDKRFDDLESRMDKGFKRLESLCFAILEIIREHDVKFSNFEKRLLCVERKLA